MSVKQAFRVLALVLVVLMCAATPAFGTDYYATSNPGNTQPPNSPWVQVSNPVSFSFGTGGGSIWFATSNAHVSTNRKFYTLTLQGTGVNLLYSIFATGYYKSGGNTYSSWTESGPTDVQTVGQLQVKATFNPQPSWEIIKIGCVNAGAWSLNVSGSSNCHSIYVYDEWRVTGRGWYGTPDVAIQMPDIQMYPVELQLNTDFNPVFAAPPETGTWAYDFSFQDPNGHPRSMGGVRWTSNGPGLRAEDVYEWEIAVHGDGRTTDYDVFAFDTVSGEWVELLFQPQMDQDVPATSAVGAVGLGAAIVLLSAGVLWRTTRRARNTTVGTRYGGEASAHQ
jgi:hypothetical protein